MDKDVFAIALLYELETYINANPNVLDGITFQLDEANIDGQLKSKLKEIILNNVNKITTITSITDENQNTRQIDNSIVITKIYLQNEITDDLKSKIKKSNQVYTNPDLLLEITDSNKTVDYISIEVKSTKNDSIPGSSVQQISEDGYVVFLQHKNNINSVTAGKYVNSLNSTMQFPDRSPRPKVSFCFLKTWNTQFRTIKNNCLTFQKDPDYLDRVAIIRNWKLVLANRWAEVIFSTDQIKENHPWFDDAIRIYTLIILEKYNSLNCIEKKNLIKRLKSAVDDIDNNDE